MFYSTLQPALCRLFLDISIWLNLLTLMLSGLFSIYSDWSTYILDWIFYSTGSPRTQLQDPRLNNLLLLLDSPLSLLPLTLSLNLTKNYITLKQQTSNEWTTQANPYKGRVPPIYNICKTTQGRLSTTQLLQTQQPKISLVYINADQYLAEKCLQDINHNLN